MFNTSLPEVFTPNKDLPKKYKESKRRVIILEEKVKEYEQKKELQERQLKRRRHSFVEGSKYKQALDKIAYLEKANEDLISENKHLRILMRKEIVEQEQFRATQLLTHNISTIEYPQPSSTSKLNEISTVRKNIKPSKSKSRAIRRKLLQEKRAKEASNIASPAYVATDLDYEELSD